MTTDIKEQEFPIYAYEIRRPNGSSELAYAAWFIKGYGKMMEHYAYDPLVRLADIACPATHPAKTEQPSLSDHEIYVFLCDLTVLRQACETDEELIPKVRALLSAQRQDSDKAECKCSLRTKLVGDGCEVCNPKLAKELAQDSDKDAA